MYHTISEKMSLVVPPNFQHILRVMNTNIEGKTNVMFAMTAIKVSKKNFEFLKYSLGFSYVSLKL